MNSGKSISAGQRPLQLAQLRQAQISRLLISPSSGSSTARLIIWRGEKVDSSRLTGQLPVHKPHSMQ
jgi:hypothetical protein